MTAAPKTSHAWRRWLPRFSLRQLLLATAFVAVGCYALRWASPWWSLALFYAVLALVIGGLLIAVNWPGERRSFWLGLVICGVTHWVVATGSFRDVYPKSFVSNWISARAYDYLKPQLTVEPIRASSPEISSHGGHGMSVMFEDPRNSGIQTIEFRAGEDGHFRSTGPGAFYVMENDFVAVARGLWTLLIAYLGGHASLALYRIRNDLNSDRTDAANSHV